MPLEVIAFIRRKEARNLIRHEKVKYKTFLSELDRHNDMLVSAKHDYDKLFILTCRNFGLFLVKVIPEI